ncbi:MAG: efflux RND transporter permease subunit, partial [Candidatus Zixiibacteriota bacterium]
MSVFVVGAFSFVQLPREVFPEVSLNWVYVITNWPGSNPEEMERLVTIPLEEEVSSVDRIESISSRSYEGASVLSIKFETMPQDEFRSLLQDVRTEVDQVTDLPDGAEDPIIFNFTAEDFIPMINVVISSSEVGEARLLEIARDLESGIKLIDGVSDVSITGERDPELWVEIDPDRLNATGVSLAQVVDAVAAKNVGVPVGSVDLGRSEYLLRMIDQFRGPQDVRDVVIGGGASSGYIRLGDVAGVSRNLERARTSYSFNGTPAVSLVVTKNSGASTLKVIDETKSLCDSFVHRLPAPERVRISYTGDTSRMITSVLNVLEKNAVIGLALVILILFFFLGFRNAFFAALGIPITFMVTFIFLHATGNSFNGNSLFGLVLVLGVVVDDAIIVIENCYRYMQNGLSPIKAAYHGTTEVVTPVLAATATTVAGFLPLMLMPGIVGQFLRIVPIVVSLALLASLLEAFLVLPSHITEWSGKITTRRRETGWRRRIFTKLNRLYVPLVSKAIRWRYAVVGAFILALSGVYPLLGMLGVEMFRDEEFPSFIVQLRMSPSVKLDETERILAQMERALDGVSQQDMLGYATSAGFMMTQTEWYFKPSVGQIAIDLKDIDQRTMSNDSLIAEMRVAFSDIAGPVSIEFMKIESGPPTGSPLEVKIKGKYLEELERAATELKERVEKTEGLFDVRHDLEPGKPELRYAVDVTTAARLGVNPALVARELLITFEGVEATSYRDGDEEIKVIVKYDEDLSADFAALDQMRLSTPDGRTIALSDVTTRTEAAGYAEIRRFNQER